MSRAESIFLDASGGDRRKSVSVCAAPSQPPPVPSNASQSQSEDRWKPGGRFILFGGDDMVRVLSAQELARERLH